MIQASSESSKQRDEREISFVALANVLLRRRRLIIAFSITGLAIGAAMGLMSPRLYRAGATFLTQGAEGRSSDLALAASQFGIRLPQASAGWGPPVYVEVLRSRAVLEPIAASTFTVPELGNRRASLADLFEVEAPDRARRIEKTVKGLERIITATELKTLSAVRVSIVTPWPSVSHEIATRLLSGVQQFNLDARKSQAAEDRAFVQAQSAEAGNALRQSQDRLKSFLERNRITSGSPELTFERERLERDVLLREQVYTSLLQAAEEARIRELRSTPAITVLEQPRRPVLGEARGTVRKGLLGAFAGGVLASVLALIMHAFRLSKATATEETREFLQLVREASFGLLKT